MLLKKIAIIVLAGALTLSCSHRQATDTLVLDVGGDPASFDPAIAEDSGSWRIINDFFLGLIDRDQHNRLIPGLAESWNLSDGGKTYIFHLRPGIKFSDGSPITTADFVFSWQRLVDPKTGSPYNFLLKDIINAPEIISGAKSKDALGVFAPDAETLVVKLQHPTPAFLVYLTTPNAYVVSKHAVEIYGAAWTETKNFVGSGAYTLNEHVKNGYVSAKKNQYYYDVNKVLIPNIKYLPYTNPNTAIAAFKTGDLDITWKAVPVDQLQQIKQEFPKQLHDSVSERTDFLYFNMRGAKFGQNQKLRQALTMAIDRDILVDKVLNSGQKSLYSIVTPTIENGKYATIKYSWADISAKERNQQAQKLYQQAGYSNNHPLVLNLLYRNDDVHKKTALAIAAMWQQVLGIKVNLETQEYKVLLHDLHQGNYDVIASGGWGADYNEVSTYTELYVCGNSNNNTGYCNKTYDALIKQASVTLSPQQHQTLVTEAIKVASNDYPVAPLFEPSRNRLISTRVQNYDFEANYLDDVQSKWFWLKN